MKIDEIIIPDELYSIYVDDFVWAKQPLKDVNHRNKQLVYDNSEIRPLFVLEQKNNKLIGLDVTTQDWSSHEYAVKINDKSFVLCDKIKEVDINFDWPLVDFKTKTFIKDKNGNLIIKHQSVASMSLQATDEQKEEIHKKYDEYIKSIEDDKLTENNTLTADDFWNLRTLNIPNMSGNLIIDGDTIRPLSEKELKNKFAVSIEHADRKDFKSREELEKVAKQIGAERIMFYYQPGDNYSGEYSFLLSGKQAETIAKRLQKKYDQKEYASFDKNGKYHGKSVND